MALENVNNDAAYKEKYRNLKRKLKFLIYVMNLSNHTIQLEMHLSNCVVFWTTGERVLLFRNPEYGKTTAQDIEGPDIPAGSPLTA